MTSLALNALEVLAHLQPFEEIVWIGFLVLAGASAHLARASRRQAVQYRRALELQRAMFDSAQHAVFSADLDGTLLTLNPAAERMLGYRAEEHVGHLNVLSLHVADEL